jgi:hypothetical protein
LIPLLLGTVFVSSVESVRALLAAAFIFGVNFILADALRALRHSLLLSLAELREVPAMYSV